MKLALTAAALTALPIFAACSASSPTPLAQTGSAQSAASTRADVRFGLSQGQIARAMATRGRGDARSAKTQPTLFVSDLDAQAILLYPANEKKPVQSGSITDGIDLPINDAVDSSGTVYVANNGNSTVTEYPLGASSPSVTLSDQIVNPNGVAVDKAGNVYVTSGAYVGQCNVLVFPKGATSPSATIGPFQLPVGLAIDAKGDLFVGDVVANAVFEVPKGKTAPKNLDLSGINDPTGVAIDPKNNLWVVNYQGNTALEFKIGSKSPMQTISSGLSGPYSVAFGKGGRLFVGNSHTYPGFVTTYKKNATSPFSTFTAKNPAGVAVYPPPKV
ncbi:MAG TPA: SMP-30/gluconolactonase/LRE family protein [Candidatus Tumulicola sp.]